MPPATATSSASWASRCSRRPTSRSSAAFQKTDAGKDVSFTTSYGASGDQSRAVVGGLHADEVHLSLEPDVTKLVDAGDVDKSWNQTPTDGILTDSVVVFLVRKGNPLDIQTWDDLVKPGVKVITPNPASSGSAKWNILAAWAHAANAPGGTRRQGRGLRHQAAAQHRGHARQR